VSIARPARRCAPAGGSADRLVFGTFLLRGGGGAALLLPSASRSPSEAWWRAAFSAAWDHAQLAAQPGLRILCGLNNHVLVNIVAPLSNTSWSSASSSGSCSRTGSPCRSCRRGDRRRLGRSGPGSARVHGGWLLVLSAASRQSIALGTHVCRFDSARRPRCSSGSRKPWRPLVCSPSRGVGGAALIAPTCPARRTAGRAGCGCIPRSGDEYQRLGRGRPRRSPRAGRASRRRKGRLPSSASPPEASVGPRKPPHELAAGGSSAATASTRSPARIGPGGERAGRAGGASWPFPAISQDVEVALSRPAVTISRLGLGAVISASTISPVSSTAAAIATRCAAARCDALGKLIERHTEALAERWSCAQEIRHPYVIGVPLSLRQEIFVAAPTSAAPSSSCCSIAAVLPLFCMASAAWARPRCSQPRSPAATTIVRFRRLAGAGLVGQRPRPACSTNLSPDDRVRPPPARPWPCAAAPRHADGRSLHPLRRWLDEVEESLVRLPRPCARRVRGRSPARWSGALRRDAVLACCATWCQNRQASRCCCQARTRSRSSPLRQLPHQRVRSSRWIPQARGSDPADRAAHRSDGAALRAGASHRVIELTRNPFLVQLLCAEIVTLKNEQDRRCERLATWRRDGGGARGDHHGSFSRRQSTHQIDPSRARCWLGSLPREGVAVSPPICPALWAGTSRPRTHLTRRELSSGRSDRAVIASRSRFIRPLVRSGLSDCAAIATA